MASRQATFLVQQCLSGVRSFWHAGLDFVFPPICPVCNRDSIQDEALIQGSICKVCVEEMLPRVDNLCQRCDAPVGPFLDTSQGCIHCRRDRYLFDKVCSLGVYNGLLRSVCLRLKQADNGPLAAGMGELYFSRVKKKLESSGVDFSLPVPDHWMRRISRFSHAPTILSRLLARRLQVKFSAHILFKVRRTPSQSSLPGNKRRTNLRGAFKIRGAAKLAGRTVLLVDDILTTGTTANEATKVLLRAGVRRVIVAVLARSVGDSLGGGGQPPNHFVAGL